MPKNPSSTPVRYRPSMSRMFVLSMGLVFLALMPSVLQAEPPEPATKPRKPEPSRLALLVGISKYPQVTTSAWRPLKAKRDLVEMKRVLMTPKYGFRAEDILVLEDREATAAGIRKAFREHLIAKARPGAIVVFHFSGHGQQVPDQNGDELDGLDETLVPWDAVDQRASEGAKINIRDDEIAGWLRELQAKMRGPRGKVEGSVNIFLDSCFSGTATRGLLAERGRGWDVDLDGPRPPLPVNGSAISDSVHSSSLLDGEGEYVALSAAQSDQTAKEVGDMGLFTRALVGALERATDQTTYRDLLSETSAEVLAAVRNQLPQIEGNPDLRLFGDSARPTPSYVRVLSATEDRLTLPIGALHLVTVGSVYRLHRAGSEPMSEQNLLGEAEVVAVEPTQSQLRVKPDFRRPVSASSLVAARAIEIAHSYAIRPLRVSLDAATARSKLRDSVQQLSVVTSRGVTPQDSDVEVRVAEGRLELRRPEDRCPFATIPFQRPDQAADRLEQVLRTEWRWRQLGELRQSNPDVQARLRLVPVEVTLDASDRLAEIPTLRRDLRASQRLALKVGDYFMLELNNPTRNDVWVTVLEMESTGAISPCFPLPRQAGDGLLRAGDTRLMPMQYVFRVAPPLGPTVFKVIATREKVDFGALTQAAYQVGPKPSAQRSIADPARTMAKLLDGIRGSAQPLARLLAESARGQRSMAPSATELGAWSVTDTVLLQEPRVATVRGNLCSNGSAPE